MLSQTDIRCLMAATPRARRSAPTSALNEEENEETRSAEKILLAKVRPQHMKHKSGMRWLREAIDGTVYKVSHLGQWVRI